MSRGKGRKAGGRGVSVAVTGGMGAGKSVVSSFLAKRLGWQLLSADSVCRSLLTPGAEGWRAFVEAFGTGYLGEDEQIGRSRLRRDIFENTSLRRDLEAILHPLARKEIRRQAIERNAAGESVLAEVPLLFEAGWQNDFEKVVVVYASTAVCQKRISRRDGVTLGEAGKAIAVQMSLKEKALTADFVVDNSGCWSNTLLQLLHLSEILGDFTVLFGKKT